MVQRSSAGAGTLSQHRVPTSCPQLNRIGTGPEGSPPDSGRHESARSRVYPTQTDRGGSNLFGFKSHRHRHFGPDRLPLFRRFRSGSFRLDPFQSVSDVGTALVRGFPEPAGAVIAIASSWNETDSDGSRRIEVDVGSSSRRAVPTLCPQNLAWASSRGPRENPGQRLRWRPFRCGTLCEGPARRVARYPHRASE